MSVINRTFCNRNYLNKWKKVICFRNIVTSSNPNILKSPLSDVVLQNVTLTELMFTRMELFEKNTAVSGTDGRSYTYEQVRVKSRNLSKSLRHKFKLNDGDVVALFLPNIPEYIICFLGALEARLIVTTLNPIYTPEEISKQIIDASPKLIITQANLLGSVRSALNLSKRQLPIVNIKETQAEGLPEGTVDFSELVNVNLDIPDLQPGNANDVAMMPYSSGTTGLPKGVQLTHKNVTANLIQMSHPELSIVESGSGDYQEVSPAVLPFYHIYGLMLNFFFLYEGGKFIAIPKFTPESYIEVLKNHPPSIIYAAPPLVLFLTKHPDVKPEYFRNLKAISSGAAPLGYLDEERFLQKVGRNVRFVQGYGLTETSPVVCFTPKSLVRSEKTAGSVGFPVPNTLIKIIDPDDQEGKPLGQNEKGEILIKGPQVMKGYYNKPEETKNTFLNGWLRTGDLGYFDENRYLFITDRLKELIKVRGFQVAPAELEELIRDHPAVEDAAVVGIPHEINGEVPRAYIVSKKGTTLTAEELDQYVADKVAKYKRLSGGIKFVESIPKNPSGKILRRQLKEGYLEKGI